MESTGENPSSEDKAAKAVKQRKRLLVFFTVVYREATDVVRIICNPNKCKFALYKRVCSYLVWRVWCSVT